MKKIIFSLLIILTSNLFSNNFQQGNIEFTNKNYTEAENYYLQDFEDNGQTFNTLFNLGNLYIEQQQFGKALFYFKKAELIQPRDQELVKIILNTEKELNIENNQYISIPLSKREIEIISISLILILSIIIFIISLLNFLNRRGNFFYKIKKSILISISLLLGIFMVGNIYNYQIRNRGVILTEIDAKISPYTGSETSFTLNEGITVDIKDTFNEYLFILDSKGNIGWIETKSLGILWN